MKVEELIEALRECNPKEEVKVLADGQVIENVTNVFKEDGEVYIEADNEER